jgi:hypothetical protein
VQADIQNAGMNLLGATPIEDADMGKFRDTLMINVMGSVIVRPPGDRADYSAPKKPPSS